MSVSRREFLRRGSFALVPVALGQAIPPAQSNAAPARATAADTLANPVGRPSAPLGPLDNNPGVIAIERRLRCACGCTLDVYTCRTTDFSCTYSPAMHAKVVAQVQRGATADQVIEWFVAQPEYGQQVLMAPPARGFNLMGYLVPGLTVIAVGMALAMWLVRRRPVAAPVATAPGTQAPGAAELERLQRALDDVDS